MTGSTVKAYLEEAHDIPYVILEPKVDHSVSFIHAQVLAVVKREPPFLEHVNEAAWSCNDYMKAFA